MLLTPRQQRLVERDQRVAVEAEGFDQSRFSIDSGFSASSASGGVVSAGSGAASTPTVCCSSPDWYISVMMSQPPTSSPLTNSCGMVGQFDRADSSWRIRGSGRMSTAANGVFNDWRIATVRAEKPHMG